MKQNMIYLVLLSFFLSPFSFLLADTSITRGPAIGEIYYIGPTVTGEGIYHSTDFGETATCMDSTLNTDIDFMSICADLTPGVLYGVTMEEGLYISYNYGQQGSWAFRSSGMHIGSNSGRNEGEFYDSFSSHSENYGLSFISHTANGFFGSRKGVEIDNQENIGYVTVNEYSIPDSIYILITYDNFENLQVHKVLNYNQMNGFNIIRGVSEGETFIIDSYFTLFHSTDYCYTWIKKNEFNFEYGDFYRFGAVGGRQAGEYYMMLYTANMMCQNQHIYVFHSLDYGKTFTVYHPYAQGQESLIANFSAFITEGTTPLNVQFNNYSIGDISTYEWDFDNDGIIDSYDIEPEFTYQDTGYYSVKLIIHDQDDNDEFIREDFIHVTDGSGIEDENIQYSIENFQLSNYPNPFNPTTEIRFQISDSRQIENLNIEIYNLKGQLVDEIAINCQQTSIIWHADDFASGIYFYKLNIKNSPTQKMLLLK